MRALMYLALLAGCGRLGFDGAAPLGDDAPMGDAPPGGGPDATACAGCVVGGSCVADGAAGPSACLACDPARASVGWSVVGACEAGELIRVDDPLGGTSFGARIASDPTTVLLGSGVTADSAVVLELATGAWTVAASLAPPAPVAGFLAFGDGVALDGDTLFVGERQHEPGGAAVFFERVGAGWDGGQRVRGSDPATVDEHGAAVAIDGDRAAAGAYSHTHAAGPTDGGAVYLYARPAPDQPWALDRELVNPREKGDGSTFYGRSVDLAGDWLAIGAQDPVGGQAQVAMLEWSGDVVTERALLTCPDVAGDNQFGASLTLVGDVLLVGAPRRTEGGRARAGAVYVFERSGSAWAPQGKLTPAAAIVDGEFGAAVAFDGTYAAIGMPAQGEAGAAGVEVWRRDAPGAWTRVLTRAAPTALDDGFGTAVAIEFPYLFVGIPYRAAFTGQVVGFQLAP